MKSKKTRLMVRFPVFTRKILNAFSFRRNKFSDLYIICDICGKKSKVKHENLSIINFETREASILNKCCEDTQ